MLVSQSKIKCWRKCKRSYYYRYILNITKKRKAVPLQIGSMVHESLEILYSKGDLDRYFRGCQKKLKNLFKEERIEYEEIINLSRLMVEGYRDNYIIGKEYKVLGVEVPLIVPIPKVKKISLDLKIDVVLQDKDKNIWLMEHKTCKNMPSESTRMSDIQTVIYKWAYFKSTGIKPKGIIWDYLRKKIPSKPKLLKNGTLSKSKNIDTTKKVYLKSIEENRLDKKDYLEILKSLEGNEEKFFRRIKMPVSDKLEKEVLSDFIETVEEIVEEGETKKARNLTFNCDNCEYFELCQSELRGLDTGFLIKKLYTERKKEDNIVKPRRRKRIKK